MGNSAAGRLAAATIDQTTNGAAGGTDTVTLARANLPNDTVNPTVSITDPGHFHTYDREGTRNADGGGNTVAFNGVTTNTSTATTGITATSTFALNGGVTQTAIDKLPPCFLTTYIIKL
jgi:hypothetical protein